MQRWLRGLIAGAVTGLAGATFGLTPLATDFEKHLGLSWLFNIRGAIAPPPEVIVVAINARASSGLGLPALPRDWPRSIHGKLIDKLVDSGAATIVFDLDFQRAKSAEHDEAFARAVARSGRVVLFERLNGMRQPVFDINGAQTGTIWTEQLVPPIPVLADAALTLAPFPLPKVQVNVFQFWAFKPSVGDAATMPSAALQAYALSHHEAWLNVLREAGLDASVELPASREQLTNAAATGQLMRALRNAFRDDASLAQRVANLLAADTASPGILGALVDLYAGDDNRYLNFYGPPGSIPTVPYNAIINGESPDLAGKVVFVGFSDLYDPGQPDRFYTVFTRDDGVDLSGVEIAATAFANLLTRRSLQPANVTATAAILLAFGLVAGVLLYLLSATVAVPLVLALSGAYTMVVQYVFNTGDVWLPLATPVLLQLPLALFIGLLGQYLLERRQKERVSRAVSYYLPESIARELSEKEIDPGSLNRVVYGACLATDMSGFTTISETMEPGQLAAFMNSYFDALAQVLKTHNVTVTEFHADTIMCAWTSESAETLVRIHPARAALALLEAVDTFNAHTADVNLNARVGLDEGQFYLGNTGGGGRYGYSILGDCANTASRMEGLNKHLGTHVLATGALANAAEGLLMRPLGQFNLVGKADANDVVEILATDECATESQKALCGLFADALAVYNRHDWEGAGRLFQGILARFPDDGPARYYVNYCQSLLINGPQPGIDPTVVQMTAK